MPFTKSVSGIDLRARGDVLILTSFSNEFSARKDIDLDALRNELIHETVRKARSESQYYESLYSVSDIDTDSVINISDLSKLPIVTKDNLRVAGLAALCNPSETQVSHIQNTSGSTGEQFFVYRSLDETRFIHEFFASLNAAERRQRRLTPIMLQLQFMEHGLSTPVPANIFVIPFSVDNDNQIAHVLLLLRKEFDMIGVDRRASILSGSQTGIRLLTNYMLEHDIECAREFNIKLVHVQGRYLTSRWRQVLERTWGAVVSDKYSLAEVFGGANWCPRCGGYHFDPNVIPEIVDFTGAKTLDRGTGVLVLTSLYPFVQLQPMIRYWTADVFTLDPEGCDEPRYEFGGRLNHALFNPDDSRELLLTGVDVNEVLDQLPEIGRTERFRDVTGVRFPQATGRLLVRGFCKRAKRNHDLTLKVEAGVPLWLFPDRQRSLSDAVMEGLMARSGALSTFISSGRGALRVDFVKPGTLGSLDRISQLWVTQ
jgi:phenylacetate-coenzyme A ligase PaaK-like adenylate-forming protein